MADEIYDDPEKWFAAYGERRKTYEDLLEAHGKRRKALEDELGAELQKAAEGYAQVAPIAPNEVEAIPRRRAAYSDRMSALMAKLSMLAYVRFEDPQKRRILEMALERAGLKLVACVAANDVEAFIVEHDYFMAVAFRGTTTAQDRRINTSIGYEKANVAGFATPVNVHAGFYRAFLTVEGVIREAVTRQTGDKPNNKAIYLTGHSLGGAIALVASAEYSGGDQLGERIAAVYTFGAPRVGEKSFAQNVKAPHYRVVNAGDIVPLVPPNFIGGYRHSVEPRLLRRNVDRVVNKRSDGWIVPLIVWSVISWIFVGRRLHFMAEHDASAYATRLERIARVRGRWT
jgi:hypothetical protein